jgi:hypothetical protein
MLEVRMKKFAIVAIVSMAATSAIAGGPVEPIMEPEVIVEETATSPGGIIVPLVLLAVIAAVAATSHH